MPSREVKKALEMQRESPDYRPGLSFSVH